MKQIRRLQEEGSVQDLINFVSGGQVPENVYLLIPTLIERGDCAQARLKLQTLLADTEEKKSFITLYGVLANLCEGKRELKGLTENEHQQIKTLSEGNTRVAVHAEAVLAALNETAYLRVAEKLNPQAGMRTQGQVNEEQELTLELEVYPNPSTGSITIDLRQEKSGNLQITDALGRRVYQRGLQDEKTHQTHLSQGLYLVQFTAVDGKTERKHVLIKH